MALTDDELARFDGPSVWRESDCVEWLYAITDAPRRAPDPWHDIETEARAITVARRSPGGYTGSVLEWLTEHGYRALEAGESRDYEPGDVVIVEDPIYGELPAGVAPGPQLLIRHPHGVAPAGGRPLHHLRRPA